MFRSRNWFRQLCSKRPAAAARTASRQPQLELLEDRQLPSTFFMLEGAGTTITSYKGVGFRQNAVASMTGYVNNQVDPNSGDFRAQVNWGDGSGWLPAVIGSNNGGSGGEFLIKGSHVYNAPGTFGIEVEVTAADGTTQIQQTSQASVSYLSSGLAGTVPPAVTSSLPPGNVGVNIEGAGTTLTTYTGVGFQENAVASMQVWVNGQEDTMGSDYQAFINWGDSSQWYQASLAPNTGGSGYDFLVKGSHVYSQAGTYSVVVYAVGPDGTTQSEQTTSVVVSNMPSGLPGIVPPTVTPSMPPANVDVNIEGAGTTIFAYAGVPFQQNIAATMEGYLNGQVDPHVADFHAFINWGDSSKWYQASLTPNTGSGFEFNVAGSHVYGQAGPYNIVVYAIGPDGTSQSGQTTYANVVANPDRADTTTAVSLSSTTSVFGQPVTLTAQVGSGNLGLGTPTGTVSFYRGAIGGTFLGNGTLNANGTASLTLSNLPVGLRNIYARYGGDGNFYGSDSPTPTPTSLMVYAASTTTTVSLSTPTSVYGQAVTLTAHVGVVAPGGGGMTGMVNFYRGAIGGTYLGDSTLNVAGTASITLSNLPAGLRNIYASYLGDGNHLGSNSPTPTPTSLIVQQAGTQIAVALSTSVSAFGQPVTLTAQVAPMAPGAGVPTGTVTFYRGAVGGTFLGTATINAGRVASITLSNLPVGQRNIFASYGGDVDFLASSTLTPVILMVS